MSFFQILEKVGHLVYKFTIPSNWKIYLVLSVA